MKGFLDAFFDSISSIFRIFDLSYFLTGSIGLFLILYIYGLKLAHVEMIKHILNRDFLLAIVLVFCAYLVGILLISIGQGGRRFTRSNKFKTQKARTLDEHIFICIKSAVLSSEISAYLRE